MYDLGQSINEQLEKHLRASTGKKDYATVSRIVKGVGMSTVRDLVYRMNPITLTNAEGLRELIREGIRNCEQKLLDFEQSNEYLEESLIQLNTFIDDEIKKKKLVNDIEVKE